MYEARQNKESIGRTFSNSKKNKHTIEFGKQNNNIHSIQKFATNKKLHSRKILQLITLDEIPSILQSNKINDNYFWSIGWGALEVMASRQGQTVEKYCENLSDKQLVELIKKLQSEFKEEKTKTDTNEEEKTKTDTNEIVLVKSSKYLKMNIVVGTNILVDRQIDKNDKNLANFIESYKRGEIVWYRGLSVTHFSYKTFCESGLLFSEGVEDDPDFTMNNKNGTRWLPGDQNEGIPITVASRVDREDIGLRSYFGEKILPIGVVVSVEIKPSMPIAYLNDGEQVIRGPVKAKLHKVICMLKDGIGIAPNRILPKPLKFGLQSNDSELMKWVEENQLSI